MVIDKLRDYCSRATDDIAILDSAFQQYMEADKAYKAQRSENLSAKALDIIHGSRLNNFEIYYILSFLLQATDCKQVYKELLQFIIHDENITKEMKFFLYGQLVRYNFLNSSVMDEERRNLHDDLYSHIYASYRKEFEHEFRRIPKEERNPDFVMVFTCQLLGMGHAPTKTLLDRCYILEKYLHKSVYIINTAEHLTGYQEIPYFRTSSANYIEAYSRAEYLEYKDTKFSFFQCPNEMPQVPIIREIVGVVKKEKPYFIVTIGGNSIVSDICSNIVPTITISTVSDRAQTRGQFQAVCRKISEEDKRWINKHSFAEDQIIESLFTFTFPEQTHSYTRKELGLPEDKFIVLVVGYRLDEEISTCFMEVLDRLTNSGVCVAFLGNFERYGYYADKNPVFRSNTVFLGIREDSLAVCECCDLYLNPKRMGGGTSAAEALFKGVPVVTLDFGDVGAGAGTDFHVKDWEEMYNQVIKYFRNKEYYGIMSKKARERAAYLTDSGAEFVRIIEKMEESQYF